MKIGTIAVVSFLVICAATAQDQPAQEMEKRVPLDHLHPNETKEAAIIVANTSRVPNVRIFVAQSLIVLPASSPVRAELGSLYPELVACLDLTPFYVFEELGSTKPIAPELIHVGPVPETPAAGGHVVREVSLAPTFETERPTIWLLCVTRGRIVAPKRIVDGAPLSGAIVAGHRKMNDQKLLSKLGISSLRSGENWFTLANQWSAWHTSAEPRPIPGVVDDPGDIWMQKMKSYEGNFLQYVLPAAALDDLRLLLNGRLASEQIMAVKEKLVTDFGKAVADELVKKKR